jgi:hypothetical protein
VKAALETAKGYGWSSAADRYLDLYGELHRLTQGIKSTPAMDPLFYSTPGDYLGREIAPCGHLNPAGYAGFDEV